MNKLINLLLLTPMAFSISSCKNKPAPTPIDVVVISGQSNGVGCTYSQYIKESKGSSTYQEYMSGYPGIQIAYDCWTKEVKISGETIFYSQNKSKDNDFVKVMLGQGNSLSTFGPEIGISEKLHEKYEGKLFLIKYACGASNLKDDWKDRKSPMYRRFIEYVKNQMDNLKSKNYAPTIKAMCWMQGEGDSYDKYYQVYYESTKEFVGNLREDLRELSGDEDFAFIDAGINNSTQWEFYAEVNEAKKKFAKESDKNVYIDTIEAGLHTDQEPRGEPDTAHYDSESQIELGHLFAEHFEQFLSK